MMATQLSIHNSQATNCYAKATTAGRRLSEGGTHEEMLRPQDQEIFRWDQGQGRTDQRSRSRTGVRDSADGRLGTRVKGSANG